MAHSRSTRRRARERYVKDGRSFREVADEVGVGKTTLQRWAKQEDWEELREQEREIELGSRKVLLTMLETAADGGDPQATYAAVQAARLAGVELGPGESGPSPKECAVILLDVLGKHPDVGPVVRRRRREVIRLFTQEVARLEHQEAGR